VAEVKSSQSDARIRHECEHGPAKMDDNVALFKNDMLLSSNSSQGSAHLAT
jgi:hypothetical protein